MGDAGPQTPPPGLTEDSAALGSLGLQNAPPPREIKVLVTGFGPFKTFLVNPSWLIASALPDEIYPSGPSSVLRPYKITIIVHPSAVRVSYNTVSEIVPALISQHDPDFILHIGVAGGRDCYSLETQAHRDGYRIKDVDEADGFSCGESQWKKEGLPGVLSVGWDEADVMRRWERGVETGLKERGFLGPGSQTQAGAGGSTTSTNTPSTSPVPSTGSTLNTGSIQGSNVTATNIAAAVATARAEANRRRGVVRLSRDAGRFLCEFALFTSLSFRWIDAHRHKHPQPYPHSHSHSQPLHSATVAQPEAEAEAESESEADARKHHLAFDRLGKVAFLHVPGWTGVDDINRGCLVAEEAIRALVGSWEDGFRQPTGVGGGIGIGATTVGVPLDGRVFTSQHSESHDQN